MRSTPAPIALATHRSNFLLMGAQEVTNWIDWIRSPDSPAPERYNVPLLRFDYAGRTYLAATPCFCDLAALRGGSMIFSIILSGGELLGARDYRHHVTRVLTSAGS